VGLLPAIPEPVAELSRATLEWDGLLSFVSQYATAAITKDWFAQLVPSLSAPWVTAQHAQTAEMRICLSRNIRPSLASLFDPTVLLSKARSPGTALESEELRQLLVDAIKRGGGQELQIAEYEMDIRYSGGSQVLTPFSARPRSATRTRRHPRNRRHVNAHHTRGAMLSRPSTEPAKTAAKV